MRKSCTNFIFDIFAHIFPQEMKVFNTTFVLFLIFSSHVAGQHFGVNGGLDILGAGYDFEGEPVKTKRQMGFHVGGTIEFQLSDAFVISSGVIFTEKGFQEDIQISGDNKTTFFYFDIPALLIYKVHTGFNYIYFQGGPYLGLGLFTNLTGDDFEIDNGFGPDPEQYRRTDLGMKFGGGIETGPWRFGICYNLGLMDIRNAKDTNVRNMVLGLDITFMFGGL